MMRRGGKDEYPRELTQVSDRGTKTQPTKRQREG
ncbi:addiction module toxin RelE [Enterobacteriaceae bacterium A-F18]|nr:addiction module toxin RelE [Enterobacteriaceae bacterium ENNIH3]AUV05439.1 addiction module toxin RelE [Enterobacteriaceae bacterium ENNIH2]PWF52305.1 addiction module toxin RelE [[Kluyvera] intestini]QIH65350.1 addiction module toxin RelE [Enterobacteriaceae bacterium A-F18]